MLLIRVYSYVKTHQTVHVFVLFEVNYASIELIFKKK